MQQAFLELWCLHCTDTVEVTVNMDCFLDASFKENDNIPVDTGRKLNVH